MFTAGAALYPPMWRLSNSDCVRSVNWVTPSLQEDPDKLCSSYLFRFSEKIANLLSSSALLKYQITHNSGFVERILPGLVLLSKLLLELAKHLLVILEVEAGPEADHQQGGDCEELHVSLLGKTGQQGQWTESLSHYLHRTVHHSPTKQSLITFFLLLNTDFYYCSPFCMI